MSIPDMPKLKEIVSQLGEVTNQDFKAILTDYIEESDNQGWEGFNQEEVNAISKFLLDVLLYIKSA